MPMLDVDQIDASLNRDFRGIDAPASRELALFAGDPAVDGDEVTGNGYARVPITKADWAPADGGEITHDPKAFPNATAAWPEEVTHWAHFVGAEIADYGVFDPPLLITAAGPGPHVQTTVYFDDITGG